MWERPRRAIGGIRGSTPLTAAAVILVADISAPPDLLQARLAHAIPRRPDAQSRHPPLVEQLPMDSHGILALEEPPDGVSGAVLGRDAQAQAHMIGHRKALQQFDAALPTQLPRDRADPG